MSLVDEVQAALDSKLKPLGFRRKGRTYNRVTQDGLTQVISLQMGPFEPPGSVPIPGLRENLYGWFTLNLGIYVPEVARHRTVGEVKGSVRESQCCIRARLGPLGTEGTDLWWRNDALAEVIPDLIQRIERDGLPFLDRFGSRDAILTEWKDRSANFQTGDPPRIVMAIILVERNERSAARVLLTAQAAETKYPGHAAYVSSLASQLGIPLDHER